MTQQQKILKHLETYKKGITSLEAFERYGCTRLSGQIFELKRKGYNISSKLIPVKNRYGEVCYVSRYKLEA